MKARVAAAKAAGGGAWSYSQRDGRYLVAAAAAVERGVDRKCYAKAWLMQDDSAVATVQDARDAIVPLLSSLETLGGFYERE